MAHKIWGSKMLRWIRFSLYSLLLVSIGFILKATLENDTVAQFIVSNLRWMAIGAIAFLVFVLVTMVVVFWILPKWLNRKFGISLDKMTDETMLRSVADRVLFGNKAGEDLTPRDQQETAIIRLGMWFMRREAIHLYFSMLLAIGGGIIGTATLYLLHQQNAKLTLQTDATIAQALLLEGTRRAALTGQTTQLIEAIKAERAVADGSDKKRECNAFVTSSCWTLNQTSPVYRLSTALQVRVQTFLDSTTPYHVLAEAEQSPDYDTLLRNQIRLGFESPERGAILQAVATTRVSAASMDFSNTYLPGAFLAYADLSNAILEGAFLKGAQMRNVNLSGANLIDANLQKANMAGANLEGARLTRTVLTGVELGGAKLQGAFLAGQNLETAFLQSADLRRADLSGANLKGVTLQAANLFHANLSGANLEGAKLAGANLREAWAWFDNPPNLPGGYQIQLCKFDQDKHVRRSKPGDCEE